MATKKKLLKWKQSYSRVEIDGKTTRKKHTTFSAKGKKNDYLIVIFYGDKGKEKDVLFVNGVNKVQMGAVYGTEVYLQEDAEKIERRQRASEEKAKAKASVTKKPATKTSATKKTTKTSSKRKENVIKINGKRYVMDESKVKMKNGKKFFYVHKTYQKQNWGRMRKWWLYVPIKKKGREQWEVYHIDKNDPTYGVFGRGKTARKY